MDVFLNSFLRHLLEFYRDTGLCEIVEFATHPCPLASVSIRLQLPLSSKIETELPFGITVTTANLVPGPSRKFTAVCV